MYKDVFLTNQISENFSNGFKWLEVTTDTSKICVVGNFDVVSQTGSVTFQNAGTWYDYLDGTTFTATGAAQDIGLQPGEYHVYLNRNVVSTIATPVTSINIPSNNLLIKVYPNPVLKNAAIDVTVPESGKVEIDLFNVAGQTMRNIYSGFLVKGTHTVNFGNTERLSAGMYVIKVNMKTSTGALKFILK